MALTNYQTVTLGQGKHSSPQEGACVMELASMLAGEPFSDHPVSGCPVIGSFLRAYNDAIDAERRQDLYAYAARVIGSRSSEQVHRDRAIALAKWRSEMLPRRWWRLEPPRVALAMSSAWQNHLEGVGAWAVRAIREHTDETHACALAAIDDLLRIGQGEPSPVTVPESMAGPREADEDDAPIAGLV